MSEPSPIQALIAAHSEHIAAGREQHRRWREEHPDEAAALDAEQDQINALNAKRRAEEERLEEEHREAARWPQCIPSRNRHAVLEEPLPDGSLWLWGSVGTGKTYAAAATAIVDHQNGKSIAWVAVPAWLAAARAAIGQDAGRRAPNAWEIVQGSATIVLDDLGVEKPSEWVVQQLYELVNAAYEEERRLIVTSNLPPSELKSRLGERIVSRLVHVCTIRHYKGTDRRYGVARGLSGLVAGTVESLEDRQ